MDTQTHDISANDRASVGLYAPEAESIDAREQYANLPPIDAGLPITLAGGYKLHGFSVRCSCCGEPVAWMRGTVRQAYAWLAELRGFGLCAECPTLTPFHARLQHRTAQEKPTLSWRKGDEWVSESFGNLQSTPLRQFQYLVYTAWDRLVSGFKSN